MAGVARSAAGKNQPHYRHPGSRAQDLEQIPRYAYDYGNGGWESHLREVFERALRPTSDACENCSSPDSDLHLPLHR